MTDNQSSGARAKSNRTESKQRGGPKVRKTSRVRDGVVLSVSAIEKERERLQRRTRAALYPLLPVVDPTRFRRPSLHTEKRRHRKHCRKRLDDDHRQRFHHHPHRHYQQSGARQRLDSRTRLVTTTSESDGSSLTCSRPPGVDPLPHCSPLCNEQVQSSSRQSSEADDETAPHPPTSSEQRQHHHHYHYHCHHHKHQNKSLGPDGTTRLPGGRDPEACDKDSSSSNSRSRKIVSYIVASVASFILLMCVALVAVTLRLTPAIDELGKYLQSHRIIKECLSLENIVPISGSAMATHRRWRKWATNQDMNSQ